MAPMTRLALLLVVFGACDTKATASDPQTGAGPRAEQKSREYESCGATLHCAENLRCFDNTCRRVTRNAIGDYYAAVASAALKRGEAEPAITNYAQAISQYEADKASGGVPPEIDCAYGAALAAGKAKKENAELAARVLHRCVLAVPVGSSLRMEAFDRLATLDSSGLDPVLLGATKTADLYLTKAAARPSADKINVTVSADPQPKKSMATITEKLTAADVKPGLIACWEAAKKDSLAVTIGVKSSYVLSEYEDVPGVFVVKIEAPSSADAGDACVRQVVEPVIKAMKMSDSFNSKITITIK